MLLTIDAGNTQTVVGLFRGQDLVSRSEQDEGCRVYVSELTFQCGISRVAAWHGPSIGQERYG